MQKYYAHTDSVRTDSKDFDYYVELYLAREVDARPLETVVETQHQTIEALREALKRWMPKSGHVFDRELLAQWMADNELLHGSL